MTSQPDRASLGPGQFPLRWLVYTLTLAALPLACCGGVLRWRAAQIAERQLQAEQNPITLKQIVRDVETIRVRLGRAPEDTEELESLLDRPMPHVHDGVFKAPIHYRKTGQDSFLLIYELWATDDWIYDSTKPEAGWVQHFY